MKFSYNLGNAELSTQVKDEFTAKLQIENQSISIEFEGTELVDALNNSLEMRKALQEGFIKIIPVVKDAIKELGLVASEEFQKISKSEFQIDMEREQIRDRHDEARHQRVMAEFEKK